MANTGLLRRFTEMIASGIFGTIFGVDTNRQTPIEVTFTTLPGGEFDPERMTPDQIWTTQPHLRTVVSFIAENVGQIGLHAYERDGEERSRIRDGEITRWLRKPNPMQTCMEFVEQLTGELALYDVAWIWVAPTTEREIANTWVIPSKWVSSRENAFGLITEVTFTDPTDDTKKINAPIEQMCRFVSWAPGTASGGKSKVDTLRLILAEQYQAWKERHQVAKRKGRFGGFFSRPKDAPSWTNEDRARFLRMTRDFTTPNGPRAGEDMLLEDGISYSRASATAQESQWAESVKLSLVTCAQVFHVNPTMVGVLDNANYSNVREFKRSLYTDTLGPIITRLEQRFNAFLLPMLGIDPEEIFVEFNVESKLRGAFEERASIMSKATGGPWMTRNETRKLDNLPPIEGGDELIVPANVIVGGLASPEDGGDGRPPKAFKDDPVVRPVVSAWIDRMGRSVASKRNAGGQWWDGMRWERELETDLQKAGVSPEEAAWLAVRLTDLAAEAYKAGTGPGSAIAMLEAA